MKVYVCMFVHVYDITEYYSSLTTRTQGRRQKYITLCVCERERAGLMVMSFHVFITGPNVFLTVKGPLKLGDLGCAVQLKNHSTMPGEVKGMEGTAGKLL